MSLETFLYSLASIPMFASRPFLAAAVTALLARVGDDVPFLCDSKVIQALSTSPDWFQSWTTVGVLVLLAIGESYATKSADVRALMEDLDAWVKGAVSLAVSLALVDSESIGILKSIQRQGFGLESLWALVIAVATFFLAFVRRAALWVIHEVDDDDDIGLQTALNWIESTWTVSGLMFIVVFPVVALLLSTLTVLGLFGLRRWKEKREERSKQPCEGCQTPVFPHATACHACQRPLTSPRAVGVFGTPKQSACEDRDRQGFDLIARKRCPVCATRLKKRAVQQPCPTCKSVTFQNQREFDRYLEALGARLPRTLAVSFALSAIPIVGVVPGVIYYRLTLISGLRGYVPPVRGCAARVFLFFVRWILIALQPIPILGAFVIPLMCWSSYLVYKRALLGRARKDLAVAAA